MPNGTRKNFKKDDQLVLPLGQDTKADGTGFTGSNNNERVPIKSDRQRRNKTNKEVKPTVHPYSWVLLHEARKKSDPVIDEPTSPIGRPPRPVPATKSSIYLTASDQDALHKWQKMLTGILERKPSLGETAGILAKICLSRLQVIDGVDSFESLADLVELLVTGDLGTTENKRRRKDAD